MTADIYTDGAQLVLELLGEYGTDYLLIRTESNGSITSQSVRGAVINPIAYITHPSTLEPVDERIVCDNRVEIKETDTIIKPNGKFNVMRCDEIRPADFLIGYRVELRRA